MKTRNSPAKTALSKGMAGAILAAALLAITITGCSGPRSQDASEIEQLQRGQRELRNQVKALNAEIEKLSGETSQDSQPRTERSSVQIIEKEIPVGATMEVEVAVLEETEVRNEVPKEVMLDQQSGTDCDSILKSQLVFQRGASNADRIMQVINQIQVQRSECVEEVWDPTVNYQSSAGNPVATDNSSVASNEREHSNCFAEAMNTEALETGGNLSDVSVGDNVVPAGLRLQNKLGNAPHRPSGRSAANDIIVYWSASSSERPADGAACWLYVSRLGVWSQNY